MGGQVQAEVTPSPPIGLGSLKGVQLADDDNSQKFRRFGRLINAERDCSASDSVVPEAAP